MKIIFVTISDPKSQGDFLEVSILTGLREILGNNCIDYPRKKIMYHDWSDTKKEELHGRGFTLYKFPFKELSDEERKLENIDFILYGVANAYNEKNKPELDKLVEGENKIWYLDGHDLYGGAPIKLNYNGENIIGTQKENCFKRELTETNYKNVYPIGFGIPEYQIRDINLDGKIQLFQKTAPKESSFNMVNFNGYIFENEEDYYEDMQKSWFGLTCKKGGWDCLRHYEIIASGTLLLFKDYDKKPKNCSPINLPCYSYNNKRDLLILIKKLVINNKPTDEYLEMLKNQRLWLINYGTTKKRGEQIINILKNFI